MRITIRLDLRQAGLPPGVSFGVILSEAKDPKLQLFAKR